ncbi:MAG: response regulator [Anaerolineae bacterium]|nr:response regulator [Anaerolineae bacterium]
MPSTRILIADDHSLVRQGIRDILEQYEDMLIVGEAWDGPSLFAQLAETAPSLLLLDVTMPAFEPVSSLGKIKAAYPNLKILVISAYDDDFYVKGLLSAGADGYHLKGQPIPQLKMAVDQVLSGEKWIASPLVNKLLHPDERKKPPIVLTARQSSLLQLLMQSLDNRNIALKMGISVKTVENCLTKLYRLLNVQSRLEAVNFALQHPEILSAASPQANIETEKVNFTVQSMTSILLVDDNARFRYELRQTINIVSPKTMVYEAENTCEAVHLIEHISPNLVLVDVILGKEDGIQCAKLLRKKDANLKIVVISAYPDKEFHRMSTEAGAIAFLDKKDIDIASLRQIIADVSLS